MRVKYNPSDFPQRIDGGIIFYREEPYVVLESSGSSLLLNTLFPTDEEPFRVKVKDEKIDLSRRRLGYVNSSRTLRKAFYPIQYPNRNYKQSLTANSIRIFDPSSKSYSDSVSSQSLLFSKDGHKMFKDDYPDLEEAMKLLENGWHSIAISKDVAILQDPLNIKRIFYKTREVGYSTPEKPNIVVIPNSEYSFIISKYFEMYNWEIE